MPSLLCNAVHVPCRLTADAAALSELKAGRYALFGIHTKLLVT